LAGSLALLFVASGCGSSTAPGSATTTTTVPPTTTTQSMSARIDGVAWSAITATGTVTRGTFTMAGFGAPGTASVINFTAPATVGTSSIGPSSIVEATLTSASGSWEAYSQPSVKGSGSVTITSVTSTRIVGTFTFTLAAVPGLAPTGTTRSITGGVFNITL
jgi:hypothetical protein